MSKIYTNGTDVPYIGTSFVTVYDKKELYWTVENPLPGTADDYVIINGRVCDKIFKYPSIVKAATLHAINTAPTEILKRRDEMLIHLNDSLARDLKPDERAMIEHAKISLMYSGSDN